MQHANYRKISNNRTLNDLRLRARALIGRASLLAIGLLLAGCAGGGGGSDSGSGKASTGARLLFSESFESQTATAPWEEQVLAENYAPYSNAARYSRSPTAHSGSYSAHYFVRQGTNEKTPIQFYADPSDFASITGTPDETSEIYFSWHEYFTSNYPFPTSSQKLLRIGYDSVDFPGDKKEFDVLIQAANTDLNVQYFCGQWGDSSNCFIGDAVRSSTPIETDQWVKLGLWMKLNSPGQSDGFLRLYKNDQLYLERTNMDLRGRSYKGVNFLWLGGNYSNLDGATLPRSGSRFIDDIEWWNTLPSELEGQTPTTLPPPRIQGTGSNNGNGNGNGNGSGNGSGSPHCRGNSCD